MCGITGFLSFNNFFSEEGLSRITRALAHRGPDAEGLFYDGTCGLGHRRLSILDLSESANQPMQSADGSCTIVFNGEVYNYREMAAALHVPLRTTSDTEVILELFAQQGISSLAQFNGMFAFAVYNAPRQELHVVRDRLGIKPLFYYWDGRQLAFASELKSLKALPGLHIEPDFASISHFLHLGYIPAPRTIYKNVFKLEPGHYLKATSQGVENIAFWVPAERFTSRVLHDEKEAKKGLEDLLLSAVQYQLISDVPLGVFLSGGIDSSTVAALASRLSNTRLNTFSIGFNEAKFNEAHYASAVAKHLGTQHHEFIVSAAQAKHLVEPMLDAYDEPYADSSAIPTMLVSQLARQHVTVALCGDGGDELFFGYGMYQWAERLANPWLKALRKPVSRLLTIPSAPRYRKAASLLGYEDESGLAGHIFSQEQGFFARNELQNLLAAGTAPEAGAAYRKFMRELTPREKQALYDLETYLPDDLLTKVDRATMRYGLEARVPLLDHRVVEFALNLAPNLKHRNGVSKYLLKEVLYQYVPKQLFDRPKRGFSVPLANWLQGDLRYLQEEYLRKEVVERYGVTRFETVKALLRQFNGGNTYVYHRVWLLIVLHYWLQKHA
jgi:asparagine synthase (glutamine-hydrolysing)